MIYKVKGKIIEEKIGEFYRKLADRTVAKQRPDGEEITRLHEEGRPDSGCHRPRPWLIFSLDAQR